MDKKLFEILACPLCKGAVTTCHDSQVLCCRSCEVAFPVKDGIPVMVKSQARPLTADERQDA